MNKTLLTTLMWMVAIVASAQSWPATLPFLGNGRLTVVSQNCEYYYTENYASSQQCDYNTEEEMLDKTQKLAQSLIYMDADIYAFCEIEPNDTTLCFLAQAMNTIVGEEIYVGLKDGLTDSRQWCKNGYLYRSDRVAPVGNNTPGTNQNAYKYRMRIQAFKELSTNEIFVLSTNHFKAKSGGSGDQGQSTRNDNASNLIQKLLAVSIDPDILIVGDLNETTSEPAVQSLVMAGYTEQLELYDPNAYSYYYSGNQLIDHVLANSSMAEQITGAGVFHVNTNSYRDPNRSAFRYSDHDPVMVAMNLGGDEPQVECTETAHRNNSVRKLMVDGCIYILREGDFYTLDGTKIK